MRHFLPMLLVLLLPALVQAGGPGSAEEFLSQYPEQPTDACRVAADTSPRDEFDPKFAEVESKVIREIARRRKIIQKADTGKKMMAAGVDVPGFEGYDQDKLKKMSKDEKRKKAEELVKKKYGMNLEELKKSKGMDNDSRMDWAESIARKQKDAESSNPKKAKDDKKKIADLNKLIPKQQKLYKQLDEPVKLYHVRLREVEDDPYGLKLRQEIEEKEKQMEQGPPLDCPKAVSREQELYVKKREYCDYMSKKQIEILSNYRGMLWDSFSRYEELDLLGREIVKAQGANLPDEAIGLSGLEALRDYTVKFKETFKYRLNDSPFTGRCVGDGAGG